MACGDLERSRFGLLGVPRRIGVGAAMLAGVGSVASIAQVPEWSPPQIQARSGGPSPFNLPFGTAFTSGTPAIGADGQVAFRLITVGTTGVAGLWAGADGQGGVVHQAPSADPVITDPGINALGQVVFDQYDLFASDGLHRFDPKSGLVSVAVPPGGPLGVQNFGSPQINDAGMIGFRAGLSSGQAHVVFVNGDQHVLAGTPNVVPGSPFTFLFTPSLDGQGRIASKAQRAAGGNEIRIFAAGAPSVLIAADASASAGSPYSGFDNGVSLTDAGTVAFIASLVGGGRGVFLSDGIETIEIARVGDGVVTEIEFFNPSANASGLVAFRGRDANGLRAIFVGDGTTLVRAIGDRSALPTDLGPGQISRPDSAPVFGGNPRINARGDLAFNASVAPLGNSAASWGTGIFVMRASPQQTPGDLDGDGLVTGADLAILLSAWGACGDCAKCPADLDGDCVVGGADLAIQLSNWGM
jgi:hypothetical protein